MIKLIEENNIKDVLNMNVDITEEYLKLLVNNMTEYMYVAYDNNTLQGFMICYDDSKYINIKRIESNSSKDTYFKLLKHLSFNANKDTLIKTKDKELIEILLSFNYEIIEEHDSELTLKKEYIKLTATNISILEYYQENEANQKRLLEQINEPLWPGAKHLVERIINNTQGGKVFIMYDNDLDHIITFGTLHDFDEIESDTLKPWIGSIYTFRPYRGNRYSEKLIKHILKIAKDEGNELVYLSSDNIGMYEKFGFELYGMMKTVKGKETQVFTFDTKKL